MRAHINYGLGSAFSDNFPNHKESTVVSRHLQASLITGVVHTASLGLSDEGFLPLLALGGALTTAFH